MAHDAPIDPASKDTEMRHVTDMASDHTRQRNE